MAKILIAGEAVVVTSALKLEDLKKVAKYRPKALYLYGGEDGKEPVFGVCVANHGNGTINDVGAEFANATRDDEKLACMTLVGICGAGKNIKTAVAEKIGPAVMQLNKLEATLPAVLEEIEAERQAIMDNIQVAQ